MRKQTTLTFIFAMLTLALTQVAIAQSNWTPYVVTNQTTETIYVTFSTWRVANAKVTATGYRTVGFYDIDPDKSHKFYAYKKNPIYFQIMDSDGLNVKPTRSTPTLSSWVPAVDPILNNLRTFTFNVVTPSFGNATRAQISFTSIDRDNLMNADGFIKYGNGVRINVTDTWVLVADPTDFEMADPTDTDTWVLVDGSTDFEGADLTDFGMDDTDDGDAQGNLPAPVNIPDFKAPQSINPEDLRPSYTLRNRPSIPVWSPAVWRPDETLLATGWNLWDPHTGDLVHKFEDPRVQSVLSSSAWRPDGALLATGHNARVSTHSQVCIWDPHTGDLVRTLEPFKWGDDSLQATIYGVKWSPDGTLLATVGSRDRTFSEGETSVQLFNPHTGQLKWVDDSARAMWWSPDGTLLATTDKDGTSVRLFNPRTGQLVRTLEVPDGGVPISWNPNGTLLAIGSGDGSNASTHVWDPHTGKHVHTLFQVTRAFALGVFVSDVSWSPDGALIASGISGRSMAEVHISDAHTGALVHTIKEPYPSDEYNYVNISWSPDATLLAVANNDLYIWNRNTEELVQWRNAYGDFENHLSVRGRTGSVSWSPDGTMLAANATDDRAYLWTSETVEQHNIPQYEPPSGILGAYKDFLSFKLPIDSDIRWPHSVMSPDGQLLAIGGNINNPGKLGSYQGVIVLLDTNTEKTLRTWRFPEVNGFSVIGFSPDGQNLVYSEDDTVKWLDTNTGELLRTIFIPTEDLHTLHLSPDGRMLCVLRGKTDEKPPAFEFWDVNTGQLLRTIHSRSSYLAYPDFSWSLDGRMFAIENVTEYGDYFISEVDLWDVNTGKFLRTITDFTRSGYRKDIASFVFDANGRLLTASGIPYKSFFSRGGEADPALILWDSNTGKPLRTTHYSSGIGISSVSPDRRIFISADSEAIEYRDLMSWQLLGILAPTGEFTDTGSSGNFSISNKGRIGAFGPYLHRTATPEEIKDRKDSLTAASVEVTEQVFAKITGITKESDGCIKNSRNTKIELEPENGIQLLVKNKKGEPLSGGVVRIKWFSDVFASDDFEENSGSFSPIIKGIVAVGRLSTNNVGVHPFDYSGTYSLRVRVVDPLGQTLNQTLSGVMEVKVATNVCGAVVPASEVLSLADRLASRGVTAYGLPTSSTNSENGTSSLNPNLRWTPVSTLANDIGTTVVLVKFLNGTEAQKRKVRRAFRAWESHANLHIWYREEGPADIRVTFPTNKRVWQSAVGTESWLTVSSDYWGHYLDEDFDRLWVGLFDWAGAETEEAKISRWEQEFNTTLPSMTLGYSQEERTQLGEEAFVELYSEEGFTFGTALHEVGHALGFHHTHCTTAFREVFVWPPTAPEVKKNVYTAYSSLTPTQVNSNLFGIDRFDTPSFDYRSVMTYTLYPAWLTARDGTSQQAKEAKTLADYGISTNACLSHGDRQALADVYGKPREMHVLSAKLSAVIEDDEPGFGLFDHTGRSNETTHRVYVAPQDDEYLSTRVQTYRYGGELRSEVYLQARRMTSEGLEMRLVVELYEGQSVWTGDLEGRKEVDITLPMDGRYHDYDVKVENTGLGGGDSVHVYFSLSGPSVSGAPDAVATNPSSSDVNGDGQINVTDLILVSNYLGQPAPQTPPVDVNGDGFVTIADLVQVAQYFGQSMTSSAPAGVIVPAGLKYATVEAWLNQARAEDDNSLVFRQGIAKLEYLLTLVIPEETALLANYPNPFNPETWIPYHLATHADVTLTIYSVDGKVVRRLDLGHQEAGYYQSKARAAYWDGRNSVGERVASGLYFYTLKAGDFSATKKMLIRK